jgi:hypothetical protein
VKDIHYIKTNNTYVLCGTRGVGSLAPKAFVAIIDGNFSQMIFKECPDASIFYSLWCDTDGTYGLPLTFYVCGGTNTGQGVIAAIDPVFLTYTHFYLTEMPWEYHKITAKPFNPFEHSSGPILVVSGRDYAKYPSIGYTALDLNFSTINSYYWMKNNIESLCVVSDYTAPSSNTPYEVVLACSYANTVTLYLIDLSSAAVVEYTFWDNNNKEARYVIQDIGIKNADDGYLADPTVSVAGFYIKDPSSREHIAWHGLISSFSSMTNYYTYFSGNRDLYYEYYKIRYNNRREYVGGYFSDIRTSCSLFARPVPFDSDCDYRESIESSAAKVRVSPFRLYRGEFKPLPIYLIPSIEILLRIEESCGKFFDKEEDLMPELIMPVKEESVITTYNDCITVKDLQKNTGYEIFNITGQIVQTGTSNPDISIAKLNKGMYILRLENGEVFKFVK